MNAYLRQFPGFEEALYDIPQLGEPFDKAKLAQISGYDQSPMYRGFGGTVDTAMGQGRHGNYVFDLLAASRGGDTEATTKLNNMNAFLALMQKRVKSLVILFRSFQIIKILMP